MVANILLHILMISPIPFGMFQRDISVKGVLVNILFSNVLFSISIYSWEDLLDKEPVACHKWDAVCHIIVVILLGLKLNGLGLLDIIQPQVSFTNNDDNCDDNTNDHQWCCLDACKLVSVSDWLTFKSS